MVTYETKCGQGRVAFEACKDFAIEFERLYAGRDMSEFPNENPMRAYQSMPVNGHDGTINFPLNYTFEQSSHGVASLAFSLQVAPTDCETEDCTIKLVGGGFKTCISDLGGDVIAVECNTTDPRQHWYYDGSTHQIRTSVTGKCLDQNTVDNSVKVYDW